MVDQSGLVYRSPLPRQKNLFFFPLPHTLFYQRSCRHCCTLFSPSRSSSSKARTYLVNGLQDYTHSERTSPSFYTPSPQLYHSQRDTKAACLTHQLHQTKLACMPTALDPRRRCLPRTSLPLPPRSSRHHLTSLHLRVPTVTPLLAVVLPLLRWTSAVMVSACVLSLLVMYLALFSA